MSGKQKHDAGHRKRQRTGAPAPRAAKYPDGDDLARNLVTRGVCSPAVLGYGIDTQARRAEKQQRRRAGR